MGLQNEEIISGLEDFLRKSKAELVEENMKPMTIDQYNDEIDRAMGGSRNGRMIKATDLKEKIKKMGLEVAPSYHSLNQINYILKYRLFFSVNTFSTILFLTDL